MTQFSEREQELLNNDEWISTCVIMLKSIMSKNKDERTEKIKGRKSKDLKEIDKSISNIKELIKDKLLIDRLKLNPKKLEQEIEQLEYWKSVFRKKVGKNIDRDFWLESLSVRLYDLSYEKQSDRVNFIYKLFYEYDFDGFKTAWESEDTPDHILDSLEEDSIKRRIRQIDKKAIAEYISN